jgi:hypothetical protein
LDASITGLPTFNLSALNVVTELEFQLPTNLRLGHLAEKIVAELIKSSTNYNVRYENVQVMEDKRTIGEIDFIIENISTKQLIHVELAYKFYLFDPSISSESMFDNIELEEVSQALCLLVSLFIPYQYKGSLSPIYEKAIKGYYLNFETFLSFNHSEKSYCIPPKKEWGMDPAENEVWTDFEGVKKYLNTSIEEQQAPLCWQKYGAAYLAFFIVWW